MLWLLVADAQSVGWDTARDEPRFRKDFAARVPPPRPRHARLLGDGDGGTRRCAAASHPTTRNPEGGIQRAMNPDFARTLPRESHHRALDMRACLTMAMVGLAAARLRPTLRIVGAAQ